jgi:hypothetical protein
VDLDGQAQAGGTVKATAILVRAQRPLRFLPPAMLRALEWVVFQWFRGLDAEHDKRWRRAWWRMFRSKLPHPVWQLYDLSERSGPYHRMHMAVEGRVFEYQDAFPLTKAGKEAFRDWLKTGAHFGHWEGAVGALVFVPSSLSYDDCSDDDMREFHEAAIEFLHSPLALQTLFPVVRQDQRMQMLEACLREPDEEGQ